MLATDYQDISTEEDREKIHFPVEHSSNTISRRILAIGFLLSSILNFSFLIYFLSAKKNDAIPLKLEFAGLTRSIPRAWSKFNTVNSTEQDRIWDETTYDAGNIALDDGYAKSMGLPRAQRFPWDQTKGMYLINGYHNLHCIKSIRTAIVEFHENSTQSSNYLHLIHCLNVLRDEILCEASDIPRYTGFQPPRKSGLGQVRMCRDWNQLEAWAKENSACWKPIGNTKDPGFQVLDRYRFCPPGSPYEEMARSSWVHGDGE